MNVGQSGDHGTRCSGTAGFPGLLCRVELDKCSTLYFRCALEEVSGADSFEMDVGLCILGQRLEGSRIPMLCCHLPAGWIKLRRSI
jgi:hypothetical protein